MSRLNSMENRVYGSKLNSMQEDIIAKRLFSRNKILSSARWTREQIKDEHNFLFDLVENEVPVIAPLVDNESLFECQDQNSSTAFSEEKWENSR